MIKDTLFNLTMVNGNKFKSERLIHKGFKKVQRIEKKKEFKRLLNNSILSCSPVFYLKKVRRKRKKTIEFPFMLSKHLRVNYSLKFIICHCKNLKGLNFNNKFCYEIVHSCKKSSSSFKKVETINKEVFIKKKLSSYRWF